MDDNQVKAPAAEQVVNAPPGLDVTGVKAPKKDTRIQTEDVLGTKGLSFSDFNLSQDLQLGLYELGFEKPSPI